MVKTSLTFISFLLVLVISGCVSTPYKVNQSQTESEYQTYISSMIEDRQSITSDQRLEIISTLEELFSFSQVTNEKISLAESYLDKGYIRKTSNNKVRSNIEVNKKIKNINSIDLNYLTSEKNKEYIIESLLRLNVVFNADFDNLNGDKLKDDLLYSNLLYFCKNFIDEQRNFIELYLFLNESSQNNTIIVYSKEFTKIAEELREKYPQAIFSIIDNSDYEAFAKKTLNLDLSNKRFEAIELLDKNIDIKTIPREKKDFDSIYFLLEHSIGKSIIPIFRSHLINTNFYATSEILLDMASFKELNDFESVLIPSPGYFYKTLSDKDKIKNFADEYNKALIDDLLLIELLRESNINKTDLLLKTGQVRFNQNSCIDRDLRLWKISLDNFTDHL